MWDQSSMWPTWRAGEAAIPSDSIERGATDIGGATFGAVIGLRKLAWCPDSLAFSRLSL